MYGICRTAICFDVPPKRSMEGDMSFLRHTSTLLYMVRHVSLRSATIHFMIMLSGSTGSRVPNKTRLT